MSVENHLDGSFMSVENNLDGSFSEAQGPPVMIGCTER